MALQETSINYRPCQAYIKALVAVFTAWKTLLLCVACVSPGPGYDTSTQLLLPPALQTDPSSVRLLSHVSLRLVRWDALYFVRVAQRNYLFEQEWAFGWGFTRFISALAQVLPVSDASLRNALAGILIAHVFHMLSVFVLFALTLQILPAQYPKRLKTAFLASMLYIISPAGLFMSAPYAESTFAFLNLLGMLLFSRTCTVSDARQGWSRGFDLAAVLASGLCWGLAATMRGNGILSGIILVYRALTLLPLLSSFAGVVDMTVTVAAGMLVALGSVIPQWVAYGDYCLDTTMSQAPAWCSHMPPSVFNYVQGHYWNVGFLRYWTLSNAPLFLLAIPVLCLMLATAFIATVRPDILLQRGQQSQSAKTDSGVSEEQRLAACFRCFSLPQAVLALLTLTNFHVQIINRISSGYPMWYIVLAIVFTSGGVPSKVVVNCSGQKSQQDLSSKLFTQLRKDTTQRWIFSATILYALIQGGLFASFLPPA